MYVVVRCVEWLCGPLSLKLILTETFPTYTTYLLPSALCLEQRDEPRQRAPVVEVHPRAVVAVARRRARRRVILAHVGVAAPHRQEERAVLRDEGEARGAHLGEVVVPGIGETRAG